MASNVISWLNHKLAIVLQVTMYSVDAFLHQRLSSLLPQLPIKNYLSHKNKNNSQLLENAAITKKFSISLYDKLGLLANLVHLVL